MGSKKVLLVGILILVVIALTFGIRFIPWPEMLLWPYLITKGWLPYRDIAIIHSPLLPAFLALLGKIFGIGILQLKIITWSLLLINAYLVYRISKIYFPTRIPIASALIFLALTVRYEGNGIWFETLLTTFILICYLFLRKQKYFLAGIFWGIAFFVKQTAFWFIFPIMITLFITKDIKSLLKFASGILLIFTLFFLVIYKIGILKEYIYWAIQFGILTMPSMGGHNWATVPNLIFGYLPFTIFLFTPILKEKKYLLLLTPWAIFGTLGAFPRWELFHLQPGLPFLSIAICLVLLNIRSYLKKKYILLFIYFLLTAGLIVRSVVNSWGNTDRFSEPVVFSISNYLNKNTKTNDKIFVLNSWDSIYALSNRLPATKPWIPDLYWYMEQPGIQDIVVRGLSQQPPEFIVFHEHDNSQLGSYKAKLIEDYVFNHYAVFKDFRSGYLLLSPK